MEEQSKTKKVFGSIGSKNELPSQDQVKFEEKDLEIKVKVVSHQSESGMIGIGWTYIAMKNASSFLIGTDKKGIKLIENGKKLFLTSLAPIKRG